nr:pyridoxamine 5'-phosphate oxidase [Bacteroidota bacterium]
MDNSKDLNAYILSQRLNYGKEFSDTYSNYDNPFTLFGEWFQLAMNEGSGEPHAMNLATATSTFHVSSRIVLLRDFTEQGFSFFTNYQSKKGQDLLSQKNCALNFYWHNIEKQVRIEGFAEKVSTTESDDYFATRPRESQIGAWASAQSENLESRDMLHNKISELEKRYTDMPVPRPPHWGGFRVVPNYFEFWQGRESRLHDRLAFTLTDDETWTRQVLQP